MLGPHLPISLPANYLRQNYVPFEEKTDEKTYHRMERRFGSFSRSVTLPAPVDEGKVDAQYRDGVLILSMPKTQEAKSRKIKVKG
jgi:HSP20 family protein